MEAANRTDTTPKTAANDVGKTLTSGEEDSYETYMRAVLRQAIRKPERTKSATN
jgi:hypothetical protein